MSSNGPQEDLARRGNVSQKMMKKIAKNVKFWLIWKIIRNQNLRQKSMILEEKESFFKQILPARAPQLEARSGIGLSCKVFCINCGMKNLLAWERKALCTPLSWIDQGSDRSYQHQPMTARTASTSITTGNANTDNNNRRDTASIRTGNININSNNQEATPTLNKNHHQEHQQQLAWATPTTALKNNHN